MTLFHAILLGITEGITEFLPISSTGHLILVSHLLQIPETASLKSFQIAVQLGAILAVFGVFYKRFFDITLLKKVFVAFLPTGIIGFTLYKTIKEYLIGNELIVAASLILGGIIMLIVEHWYKTVPQKKILTDIRDISYTDALKLGFFQSIAMIPGVSRSGATIIGGLWMGLPRVLLAEFTFLLAVPTMVAATGYDMLKSYKDFTSSDVTAMIVGFIAAFIVALGVVKWLLAYIKKHDFTLFAWYRIILGLIVIAVLVV